jgi:hypothetical protein
MPDINEVSAATLTPLGAALAPGVGTISSEQTITFTQYVRVILPLDGFAFWVKADTLAPSALLNSMLLNAAPLDAQQSVLSKSKTQTVKGSLHYATENRQDEAEGFAVNRVIFTSETEIELLNTVNPTALYIGQIDGLKFSFSRRGSLYRQAGLFHYQGDALYPSMATQVVDGLFGLDLTSVVVSNSLPLWLTLNQFMPMYPSYLVPDNIVPPWCAVHIEPGDTQAMTLAPYIDSTGSHWQLASDKIKLSIYGLRNARALDFIDYVLDYSLNTNNFGLMNTPIVRDEKITQAELNIISQKKTITFEVNYYQATMKALALQYIKSAFITLNSATSPFILI